MSQLLDIISRALTLIGQLGQGQTANAEDGQLGFQEANTLLDQASAERLMIAYVGIREYPLQAGVATYTLGPTAPAPFTGTRPTLIESAQINVLGSNVWIPINVADKAKWDAIINRGASDEIVTTVFPQYTYPDITFFVHPKPIGAPTIRFGTWEQLTAFTSLASTLPFPPAYEEWILTTLAIRLATSYDQPVPANVLERQAKAEASVMRINAQSIGGAVSPAQQLQSPNVGQPIPQTTQAPGAAQ